MELGQRSSEREVYIYTNLPKEIRKILYNLMLHPNKLEKEKTKKNLQKERKNKHQRKKKKTRKQRLKINTKKKKKLVELQADSLKRLAKLINLQPDSSRKREREKLQPTKDNSKVKRLL